MNVLDYTEREGGRTFATLMSDYAASHERVYKAVTLLTSGGGAAGAYALARAGDGAQPLQWWPIAALSLWWFSAAVLLLSFGMRSNKLSSGATPEVLGKFYASKGGTTDTANPSNEAALVATRWADLKALSEASAAYQTATTKRVRWLDVAYLAAALSPLPAGAAWYLALRCP